MSLNESSCETDLGQMATSALLERATDIRKKAWGDVVTYSRKVFVPLTNMCRDTCGYCTFVKHPDDPAAELMSPEAVLKSAKAGEAKGCKELLFSLGEKPELRYEKARAALRVYGYDSLTDYLHDMCRLVLDETGLLPHVNAGSLTEEELAKLRSVSASMGMMLETISRRLTRKGMPHFACPDKTPVQRLRTLERAGKLKVPFTTGLLIGIGETWDERMESLRAIRDSHLQYGHLQEVIVQNFQRKPGIAMENHPEPTLEDMLRTLAAARIILPPDVSVQAPPNLSNRHIEYLSAGINDWGGISPVTIDFINPQHDWPEIRTLADNSNRAGYRLQERLTVYPSYLQRSSEFLAPEIASRALAQSRQDGLATKQEIETC